jgi:PAS domain S-box-containing protein
MKQHKCWPSAPTILTLVCFILIIVLSAGAQLKQTRRVLIINDLGIVSSPGFAEVDQAILSALQNSPYQIELYDESLQLTFFPDEASQRAFSDSIIRKYSVRKPDLIIAAGSASFKFIAESHEGFIRETPIIFCALLGEIPDQSRSGLHVTGVMSRLQPQETLKVALQLLPGTKHVVVVGGEGKFDEVWERVARQAFQNYETKLEFTYLSNLTMPVLLERLRHLPSNTIVYHTSIAQDAAGERFIGSAQSVPLVASAANAPVFVMDDVDLRAGTVGGALVNWADAGRVAGDMAVRVLNGQRPEDIPIGISKNAYMFDWRALERWGLKESNLPPGSIVLNRQPTFWEAYKEYVIGAILVLLAQTVAIFALLRQRAKTRKTQAELRKSEDKFSKAFQRSPLAFTLASLVDNRFVEVNDTFERYAGWTREQVIGRTPLEIQLWVNTNQRSTFIEQLRAQGSVRSMEILFRRKDGQVRTGLVSSELIDINGEPCALSLIADVTEAKQAERARHASEERLRLAQQAARIGTFEWNIRTGVNTWTQELEAMYGLPRGGFGGTQIAFENLVHPDDLAGVIELIDVSLKTGQPTQGEWRAVWPDGSAHWIAARWQVFMDEAGEPLRMVGINIDVTERKLAEESLANIGRKLIEAHEEERAWIARELHDDINQRIALLAIELDRWSHDLGSGFDTHDHIQIISQRLAEIGKDIQALSHRLHSSKLEYLGIAVAAKSFCRELSEKQKVQIDFSHSDIPHNLPKEIALCLFRVLQEALQNGVKHSGVRHFKVELHATPGEIQLSVSDAGIGFNWQDTINRQGLGLISMRERLQLVEGNLAIKSEPGHGTTISARVPLAAEQHRKMAG